MYLALLTGYLTAVVSTFAIMGVVYLVFWVILAKPLRRRRIQLSRRAGLGQLLRESRHALLALAVNTVFVSAVLLNLQSTGLVKIYEGAFRYGVGYELLAGLGLLLLSDTWFYWMHRFLHSPKVYKYIHAVHHESLDVTPFTSNSFHWLEALLLTVYILPATMIFPISTATLGVVQVLGTLNNIKSHLGYELYPGWFRLFPFNQLVTSTHHNLHHTQYHGNYGLFFNFWDRVCGTELRDTNLLFEDIQQRRRVKVVDNTRYQPLTITDIVRETQDTVSFHLRADNSEFYNYRAGQYLNLRVRINGRTYDRCFSLSSSPARDDFLRITVKLNGVVSHYLHKQARVGDTLCSLLPVGNFTFDPDSNRQKHYLFVAGGSGITVLYSMLRTLLIGEPRSTVTLLYAHRSAREIIFGDGLARLARKYSTRLFVEHFVSGQNRLQESDIARVLQAYPEVETYICGPVNLKRTVHKHLVNNRVSRERINSEDYADGYVSLWTALVRT